MIRSIEFYINDPDPKDKWIGFFAIETNIRKRIGRLSNLNYNKWNIKLSHGEVVNSFVEVDDGKNVEMTLFLNFEEVKNCIEPENIRSMYDRIFVAFLIIWKIKGWDENDLVQIQTAIIKENYEVWVVYRKILPSPNKKYKAQFLCQLFPDYADIYMEFIDKGNVVQHIKFLTGGLDPYEFFGFFSNRIWKDNEYFLVSDSTKNIFYIFNINSDQFSIEYRPINFTLEECKGFVKSFEAGIAHEEKMKLLGPFFGWSKG